jgi:hypothetical protein
MCYMRLISWIRPRGSETKLKNFIVFAFTYVSESSALLNGDFYMNSHNVDSNKAMKH